MNWRSKMARGGLAASLLATGLMMTARPEAAGAAANDATIGWSIDANTLTVVNANEDNFLSDGDEPKIAVIAFRTRLGVGGTSAWKLSDFTKICTDAVAGDTCAIPDSVGRAFFGSVDTPTKEAIAAGTMPELIGTVQVALEDDQTPSSIVNGALDGAVRVLRTELDRASTSVTPADLANPQGAADRFAAVGERVKAALEPSVWQEIGVFLSSFGDFDQVVGMRISAMLGVDASLRSEIEPPLRNAMAASGVGAVLRNRSDTLVHVGSGAQYDIAGRTSFEAPRGLGRTIVARHSGKCLDVAGGWVDNGIKLTQWDCLPGQANQQFAYIGTENQYANLVAQHSFRCLDVAGGWVENGIPAGQWDCLSSQRNQQFIVRPTSGGFFKIIARHSGRCLDVGGGSTANGAGVVQWDCHGGANQEFRFV